MILFSRESLQAIKNSFHLIEKHWDEVAKDQRRLMPYWSGFDRLEMNGCLACFTMTKGDDIIGYAVFILQPDLHAAETLTAFNDAIFLSKEYRKTGVGQQFMRYCENQLKNQGVNMVLWHVKPAVDYSNTLKEMGYSLFSTVYGKKI